jgi:hypothetical protein
MNFGYTNPIRSMERKMSPDFAQRQFRDPGVRSMRSSMGLGSLHKTMPHLRHLIGGAMHFQGGGGMTLGTGSGGLEGNPVGQLIAAETPNTYNPDPRFRQFMKMMSSIPSTSLLLQRPPSAQFVYQHGGAAPDVEELGSPDDELSPGEQQEREVVLEALAALDGQSPDPESALKDFIDTFGPRALADLQQLLEEKHQDRQGGEEDEVDQEGGPGDGQEDQTAQAAGEVAGAGGGLLRGKGTGQSDEIEGVTPSGHPVLLSDGEYVIDAPTVAALGDGSTEAGARRLDALRKQIRQDAYGNDKQAKPMAKGGRPLTLRLP